MCNYVPGECIALVGAGPDEINKACNRWELPGQIKIRPLLPSDGTYTAAAGPFRRWHIVELVDIPEGLEMLGVSKLSAALSDYLGEMKGVVELNLYQPLAVQPAIRRHSTRLGQHALEISTSIRRTFERSVACGPLPQRRPLAVLDSGLQLSDYRLSGRAVKAREYTDGSRIAYGHPIEVDHDERAHGSRVLDILDSALPGDVPIVSGRVVRRSDEEITVLRVASAYAHIVACEDPLVVNLSLAPRDDALVCPQCAGVVPTEAFHSLILANVFRIAGPRTTTVMAAGNSGRLSNARHFLAGAPNAILVEASGSDGQRARYSNLVDTTYIAAARCFGGDRASGDAFFLNAPDAEGTSFAAPFVAAAAYAYIERLSAETAAFDRQSPFESWCSRFGLDLGYRSPDPGSVRSSAASAS